ncbi:MAG: hypothetical protein PHX27_04305, partial [Candidatus ainarchaeum sp.]|nr:hypothetical protein [Candidatus ainarchaeum sp.]
MISEKLAGFYTKLEDKYFDLLDSLDKKGLPVYTYSDFFEDKGIPSFIITITILLLLILGIGFFATTPLTGSGEMIISLKDITTNQPLQNVSLKIYNEQNELIYSQVVSNGNKINIPPQKQGTILKLIAEKQGYENGMANQMIGLESTSTSISLSKQFVGIRAKLRLTDSLTTTKITSAIVTARYGEQIFNLTIDGNGIYTQSNVPQGETLILSITADGYNPLTQEITFFAESTKDLTLEPSNNGFVGMASLIITVSDFDGKSIDDAEVTIYNKTNQAVLLKKFSQQGAVSDQIQTGIPLKITIKKEGYLNYDSDNDGGITLREQEKKIDVLMAKGGEKLLINSVNSLGLNLSGTLIQLFDMYGEVIDEGITTSSGIEFIGLNPDSQIFITAYKEGFLPERTKIIVSNSEIVTLVLKETNQTNSFRLDFFTLDSFGNTVTNARITLIEIIDGNREPVGYEEIITSLAGYASAVIKSGGVYEIQAETFVLEGYKTIEVNETTVDNKVYLNMTKKANVIELKLIDLLGESIRGNAIISTLDGTTIYDGNIQNGKIFFNRLDYKMVELKIELDDGNIFLENVYVYGKDFIEIIVYNKDSDELAPIIEFVGLENENGEIVKGITPGAFYWAKFSVKWPIATEQGGVHFRTGQNNIEFVESENIAIFDLSLQNASKIFSYTYSPTPLPGNESLDRTNQGFENEANKWVEGIVNNPKGTYVAKVKIRASDFTAGKIPINYRAWSQLQNQTYRTPTDPELENNNFSQEKSGLYAKTLIKELTLFESLPECTDDLCVAFNFVDNKENYFDLTKFEALEHEIYALEVEFTATNADYLQINLTTDSNLTFLGVQNNNFNFMTETGYTSKEASSVVSLTANSKQKIRIYFIAQDTGTNIINFSASGKEDIIKTISFESVIEKELIVELSEKKIKLGRNFTIKVLEQNLRGIDNALIKIINKQGEVVKSIVGNGTDGIGKDGLYRIQNDLEQGIYTASVTAQKYKEKTEAFIITNQDILTINDEFNAKLMFEEKTRMIDAKLTNNSDFLINDISFQSDNSENFKIDIITPHSIAKQQSQNIQINITYIGKEESADETIELQIKGLVENTFLTSTSTIINATYNRTLNSNCLVLTPSSLKLAILGSQGAQGNSVIEATNNCEMPISLKNRVSEKTKRSYIAVTSEDIILQPGQTSNLTISANNLLDRVFNRNETYNFEIIFDSNYLKKVLPITIELINPRIALSYPGQITLFLAQNNAKEKAIAIQPVFVTNVSQFSVEGIGFSVNTEYATQSNVKLTIEPPAQVSLESGQSINPTKMIVAEASTKFSEPVKSQILISGRMGNLDSRVGSKDNYDYQALLSGQMNLSNYNNNSKGYSTGTDNLGIIEVMTYYSGYDCLKISGVDNSTFNLTQDGLGRNSKITIQNDCAEPVRLLDIKANYPNLLFSIPNLIISPGQMIETQMGIMSMGGNVNLRSYPLTLRGLTEISQTPIEAKPFNVNIFSGVNFNEEYSKSETGIKAMVCMSRHRSCSSAALSSLHACMPNRRMQTRNKPCLFWRKLRKN